MKIVLIFYFFFLTVSCFATYKALAAFSSPQQILNSLSSNDYNNLFDNKDYTNDHVVTAFRLNVRNGPSTNFEVIRQLVIGQTVDILETIDDWVRISRNEWININYIDMTKEYVYYQIKAYIALPENDREIEINLLLSSDENRVQFGRYRYIPNKNHLFLRGRQNENLINFVEVDYKNNVTGQIALKKECLINLNKSESDISECSEIGKWMSPDSERNYKVFIKQGVL